MIPRLGKSIIVYFISLTYLFCHNNFTSTTLSFTTLERQNRLNHHDPTKYQQLPRLLFPRKIRPFQLNRRTKDYLRRDCNTPLPPSSLSSTIFASHRSITHAFTSNSWTHVRYSASLEDRITQSAQSSISAGAYYFILVRGGR